MSKINLYNNDCLVQLKEIPDNSVDSIVTDPPYGLAFMNKKWDYDVPSQEIWEQCLRVLKPGGHLLSFSGSRTYHRMVVRIEDAGFEIRDQIMWIYSSGFPKGLNIGKAVDKLQGNNRQVVGKGWETALKPAHEPIVMARKPLSEKSVVENFLEWGTGGINIDENRIGTEILKEQKAGQSKIGTFERNETITPKREGRFPANLIFDEEAGKILDKQSGDGVGASRFFYCAKTSKKDREEGNNHPTVKPTDLMLYLIRLVTPKGGTTLDPFMGSGSTGKAAMQGEFSFVGIEKEKEYFEIAKNRIKETNNLNKFMIDE